MDEPQTWRVKKSQAQKSVYFMCQPWTCASLSSRKKLPSSCEEWRSPIAHSCSNFDNAAATLFTAAHTLTGHRGSTEGCPAVSAQHGTLWESSFWAGWDFLRTAPKPEAPPLQFSFLSRLLSQVLDLHCSMKILLTYSRSRSPFSFTSPICSKSLEPLTPFWHLLPRTPNWHSFLWNFKRGQINL